MGGTSAIAFGALNSAKRSARNGSTRAARRVVWTVWRIHRCWPVGRAGLGRRAAEMPAVNPQSPLALIRLGANGVLCRHKRHLQYPNVVGAGVAASITEITHERVVADLGRTSTWTTSRARRKVGRRRHDVASQSPRAPSTHPESPLWLRSTRASAFSPKRREHRKGSMRVR
jgi:hypothetical protein